MRSSLLVSILILPLSAFAAPISSQSFADTSLTPASDAATENYVWEENAHMVCKLSSRGSPEHSDLPLPADRYSSFPQSV